MVPLGGRLVIHLGSLPLGRYLIDLSAVRRACFLFVSRSEGACHPERRRREGSVDSRTPHSTLPWNRDGPGTNPKPEGPEDHAIPDAGDPQGVREGGGGLCPPGGP